MREIVLDTETTGLDPASGHRLVEIACVESVSLVPTGATFHAYINPQRSMPVEAFNVHGLSQEFLSSKPLFEDVCSEFLNFIGDSRLIIHNAEFDMKFLNAELARAGRLAIGMERVFDTLSFARKKFPGASNSLDALCARFKINNSKRTKHGALLDAELLAEVYAELLGGRQTKLVLAAAASKSTRVVYASKQRNPRPSRTVRPEDRISHSEFAASLGYVAIWKDYTQS